MLLLISDQQISRICVHLLMKDQLPSVMIFNVFELTIIHIAVFEPQHKLLEHSCDKYKLLRSLI